MRKFRKYFRPAVFGQVVRDQNKVQFSFAARQLIAAHDQNARTQGEGKQALNRLSWYSVFKGSAHKSSSVRAKLLKFRIHEIASLHNFLRSAAVLTYNALSTSDHKRGLMENSGAIVVNGIRIESDVLRKDAIYRCAEAKCKTACCSAGVWLKDEEGPRILKWAGAVKECLPTERHDESKWLDRRGLEMGTTTVEDPLRPGKTCCVFLQPDRKCALHVVSQTNHLGWPGLKPYYCAIYPLYFEAGVLSMDDNTLHDSDCTSSHKTAPNNLAMYDVYRDEAILVLGENGYRELRKKAAARDRE